MCGSLNATGFPGRQAKSPRARSLSFVTTVRGLTGIAARLVFMSGQSFDDAGGAWRLVKSVSCLLPRLRRYSDARENQEPGRK